MLVVLHFCQKDAELMVKNLDWWISLDGKVDFHAVLSHDDATPAHLVRAVKRLADQYFKSVEVFWYPEPRKKSWPAAPNWAWQNTARFIAATKNESWFWIEADVVAIRKGWLKDIWEDHVKCGKPFSGHIVGTQISGHVNGVAVYPPNVALYSIDAFRTEESAWDVVLGKDLSMAGELRERVNWSEHLFQHCWVINPATGLAWNGNGDLATFKNTHDVVRWVSLAAAIFHRCKDGTLIDMLRLHYAHPELAMVPQHTEVKENETEPIREVPAVATEAPVAAESIQEVQAASDKPEPVPFTGVCEILIVTYGLPTKRVSGLVVSDFDWLKWCLRCIRKHCTGFAGITVAFPGRDASLFLEISNEHAKAKSGIPLRAKMYEEVEGKGMIQHMAQLAFADVLVPKPTTHVLHVDADYMFKAPVSPSDYIEGDKPVYVVRTWDSLFSSDRKTVSDCYQWKVPTDRQLGFDTEMYAMCRFPFSLPVAFYPNYRKHIEGVHGTMFLDYMLSGRNSFPQDRMDWTAMGAYAFAKHHGDFKWIDVSGGNHLAPKDKIHGLWSHGGISPEIQRDIEGFLK